MTNVGEIVGLAGLAGSGRSTLLRLLFGVERLRSGNIVLEGRELAGSSPAVAISRGIGLVPEDRSADALLSGLSVESNLSIIRVRDYWRHGMMQKRRQRRDAANLVDEYMVRTESPATQIEALSGGNQQKVVLARWMQQMPRLLLLDEPTQGVDVGARAEIWRMIQEAARGGTAALLVSSDVEELVHLATRILVLRDGGIQGDLRTENLDSADQINQLLHEMAATP